MPELPTGKMAVTPARLLGRAGRITSLDVLRGFAMLGILTVNIEDFAGPETLHDIPIGLARPAFVGWHAHLDLVILTLKWMFVEGKMRAMFAMLFGAGAVLLTQRSERRGQEGRAADIFLRRNMWLALFGLIHGTLIWNGDILLDYGLLALLFLFPLRHVRPRRLVTIGAAVWLVGGTLGLANFIHTIPTMRAAGQLTAAIRAQADGQMLTKAQVSEIAAAAKNRAEAAARTVQAVKDGRDDYLASVRGRTASYLAVNARIFTSGFFAEVLGAMMVGMGLYGLGFLSGSWSSRSYLRVMCAGYAVSWPIVLIGLWHLRRAGFTEAATDEWAALPYDLEVLPGALANASLLLLVLREGWLRSVSAALAAVGRTAFSNYIMTSLLCQFVFAWGPWKLFGKLEYYQYLYVVAAVWALNLSLSTIWLRFFAFGPLEWVWRSLTYWRRQPFLAREDARLVDTVA